MISLRRLALQGTALQHACAATIRVRLIKIGVAIIRNTRRIRLMFASHHPYRDTFLSAAQALASSTQKVLTPARHKQWG